jgi:hypothetical protein
MTCPAADAAVRTDSDSIPGCALTHPACHHRDRKAAALLQRQDRLLHCCLALLLNLAEDPATERKMKNKVG